MSDYLSNKSQSAKIMMALGAVAVSWLAYSYMTKGSTSDENEQSIITPDGNPPEETKDQQSPVEASKAILDEHFTTPNL